MNIYVLIIIQVPPSKLACTKVGGPFRGYAGERILGVILGSSADFFTNLPMILLSCGRHVVTKRGKEEKKLMKTMILNLKKNIKGQDLIEYALMAGFVAVAAGAIMPKIGRAHV